MNKTHKVFVTYLILAVNVAVFLWLSFTGSVSDSYFMAAHGALISEDVISGKWYELFTSMFLHFGAEHLAGNMIVLIAVGVPLEKVIGPVRYFLIYIISGLAGNILSVALELASGEYAVSAGASGAVLGLMGSVIYVMIRHRGYIGGLSLPRVILAVVITLYTGFRGAGINNAAHIGGLICGFVLTVILYHPKN